MALPRIPVYVLGETMKEIRTVTSVLSADIDSLNGEFNEVWKVHRDVKLRKEYPIRVMTVEDNKRHEESRTDGQCVDRTACSRELASFTCSPEQAVSQYMECLKSASDLSNSPLNDNGYASGDNMDKQIPKDCSIQTDMHEIALLTKPKSELPSLILHRVIHAGILVLAVDAEQFDKNMELYEKTLRELGTYSCLTKAGNSELIVVNIAEQSGRQKDASGFEKNARKLFNAIRMSYFGLHFGKCCLTELEQKICEIVSRYKEKGVWPTGMFTNQRSTIQTLRQKKGIYTEKDHADISESTLEQSDMFYFQVLHKSYICCGPDELVQKYISLIGMLEKRDALALSVPSNDFTLSLDECEINIMLCAFAKAKLLEEEGEIVHLFPLITPSLLPEYDEERTFKIETNVLRLAIDISIVPTALMVNIIMRCVHLGWVVKSKAPKACVSRDALLLEKGFFGVVMIFDSAENKSNVGLCIIRFQTDDEAYAKFDCDESEKLRNAVESEVESCTSMTNHKQGSVTVCGQYIRSKDAKDVLRVREGKWTDVTKLMSSSDNVSGIGDVTLLKQWYPSKSEDLEESMNKCMTDDVLSEIAELFGGGYKLFFIGQKIPSSVVDRTVLENQNNVTDTVFKLLKKWIKINGHKSNLSLLRRAIKDSSIDIDLSKFDEIVKKSQKNTDTPLP